MSEVDAIVLDLDGGETLDDLIRSMERQTAPFGRIILWDNGSRVPLAQRIAGTSLPVEVHRSETNLGFAGGVNAAMRLSKAPLVAWINNDVRLEPRWLEAMVEAMRDERLGAVQSIISGEDGRIDGAGITIADGTFRQRGHSLPIGTPLADPLWGVSATAAVYRRAALQSVSRGDEYLDERFFAYYEDVELAARLAAAGWRAQVVDQPLASHRGSMSESRIDALRLRTRNRYLVRRLHPEVGSFPALLKEDAREIFRSTVRGRIARVARIKLAVFEGLLKRL
jgi:GT2 family glycosyltransferase